jgi:hypothetical protein
MARAGQKGRDDGEIQGQCVNLRNTMSSTQPCPVVCCSLSFPSGAPIASPAPSPSASWSDAGQVSKAEAGTQTASCVVLTDAEECDQS